MKFPQQGKSRDSIMENLEARKGGDVPWAEGRVFAYIYDAGEEAKQLLKDAFNSYFMENGLDPTSFPSCMELEKDVIGMAVDLVNGGALIEKGLKRRSDMGHPRGNGREGDHLHTETGPQKSLRQDLKQGVWWSALAARRHLCLSKRTVQRKKNAARNVPRFVV